MRYVIGLSASMSIIITLRYLYIKKYCLRLQKLLAEVGTRTLGVYLIQVIFAEGVFKMLSSKADSLMAKVPYSLTICAYDIILTPIATAIVIAISYVAIELIRKKETFKLLIGE